MLNNTDFFTGYNLAQAAAIPIILALVQMFKLTGWVQDKYAPIIAVVVGIGVNLLVNDFAAGLGHNILTGILLGLSASGLYSGVQTMQKHIEIAKAKKQKRYEEQHNK